MKVYNIYNIIKCTYSTIKSNEINFPFVNAALEI